MTSDMETSFALVSSCPRRKRLVATDASADGGTFTNGLDRMKLSGTSSGYKVVPSYQPSLQTVECIAVSRRARFEEHALWVTSWREDGRFERRIPHSNVREGRSGRRIIGVDSSRRLRRRPTAQYLACLRRGALALHGGLPHHAVRDDGLRAQAQTGWWWLDFGCRETPLVDCLQKAGQALVLKDGPLLRHENVELGQALNVRRLRDKGDVGLFHLS